MSVSFADAFHSVFGYTLAYQCLFERFSPFLANREAFIFFYCIVRMSNDEDGYVRILGQVGVDDVEGALDLLREGRNAVRVGIDGLVRNSFECENSLFLLF